MAEKYLYNGFEFYALPEYDETAFPYVYLIATDMGAFDPSLAGCYVATVNAFSTEPILSKESGNAEATNGIGFDIMCLMGESAAAMMGAPEGVWVNPATGVEGIESENYNKASIEINENFVWCSKDLRCDDGTIYMKGSKPVPVGGADEPSGGGMSIAKKFLLSRMFPHLEWFWWQKDGSTVSDELPDGVLESADGYALQDSNGVFLIAKESE